MSSRARRLRVFVADHASPDVVGQATFRQRIASLWVLPAAILVS